MCGDPLCCASVPDLASSCLRREPKKRQIEGEEASPDANTKLVPTSLDEDACTFTYNKSPCLPL